MDAQEVSDAMSGAVHVVDAAFPHGASGEHVELGAASAGWEVGILQLQMAFQYEGIVGLLFFGKRTKGNGTGNVGCTIQVLCSAIK